jgi:hypothetical protein
VVRVSLMNKGSDAYRPEDFGEHITVERRIEPTGTSSYRLLAGNPYDPVRVFTSMNLTGRFSLLNRTTSLRISTGAFTADAKHSSTERPRATVSYPVLWVSRRSCAW